MHTGYTPTQGPRPRQVREVEPEPRWVVCLVEHLTPADGHWGQVPVTFPELSAEVKLPHAVGTSQSGASSVGEQSGVLPCRTAGCT